MAHVNDTIARVRAHVIDVVTRAAGAAGNSRVSDSDALFTSGRLDSLQAMETMVFLEREFGIDLSDIGFDLERIDSIERIADLAAGAPRH